MKPNVFVFFLDTVRFDQLRLDPRESAGANFLEQKLREGSLLDNFIVAGNSTRVSVNAVFNGFFGGTSGFNFHWGCDEVYARSRVISLADVFKYEGYRTLAVSQGDVYLPTHGFDTFSTFQGEIDSHRIWAEMGADEKPSFVYLHFSQLHDLAFGQPELMTRENYRIHLDNLAVEVETVWEKLVGPQDVAVIVSDHGLNLREKDDPDWRFYHEEEPTGGIFLGEETVRGVCSFWGPGRFPRRRIDKLTRSVDVLPTLLDGLQVPRPGVQGVSLWPALSADNEVPNLTAYMETGGQKQQNGQAPSRGVRTEEWKYLRYEAWGERLHHLAVDPEGRNNLIGEGLPQEKEMRELFQQQVAENARGVSHFQASTAELCARILDHRGPAPEVCRGPRRSCFEGMITDEVRDFLKAEAQRCLPLWREQGQRVVLYSASEHTRGFLAVDELVDSGVVVGVVDGNPDLAGSSFCGVPVHAMAHFEEALKPTLIVVGHYFFANDMYLRLRENCRRFVPVVNVYRLDETIPLWWDRVNPAAVDSAQPEV